MTIKIIGTSHIAQESIDEIKKVFLDFNPDIVAVELDEKRLRSLLHKGKSKKISLGHIRHIGMKGYLFALIAKYAQTKLGKLVNVMPGSDMMTAVKLAQIHKKRLALIDQDIDITLKKFSKAFTWKEKWNFFVDILKSIFFPRSELKKIGIQSLDLTKVPSKDLIIKLIARVKDRYPNLYHVLIKERNMIMARRICQLDPSLKVLVIIGAGHEDEMTELIDKIKMHKVETVQP